MTHRISALHAVRESATSPWLAGGLLCALAWLFIAVGHEGRRVAQVLVLLMPLLVLLAVPLQSAALQKARALLAWLWVMLFVLDGVARGYLQDAYQAAPNGALVLGAAANTNVREGSEYLMTQWRTLGLWTAALLLAGWATWQCARALRRFGGWPGGARRSMQVALVLLLAVTLVAYASKPWRRLHPVAFWFDWAESVQALRKDWSNQGVQRLQAMDNARALAPRVAGSTPSTIVLVIGDSVNRDNMSLYGYARNTTPQLQALQQQAGAHMLVLRNAWSVAASTLPALHGMFNIPVQGSDHSQHLLAIARQAGYRVWWVSNHDDLAIEQQHAQLADVVQLVNRMPGRSSESLDGELLDEVKAALADPHERKLIVVQLLGAHPHYRLRFPENANPFDDHPDTVENQLIAQGRPGWVRGFRQEYDAAVLYHDSVIADLLRMTQASGAERTAHTAWMYLSDHGQEVGHTMNHAGHSQSTASGFRIPAILWRSEAFTPVDETLDDRPFRGDWIAFTLADLMGLEWDGQMRERNVLASGYQWQEPVLPAKVASFTR
ncbi:phosphoethanolamine transferase [Diaphorobacter ruginosibacter]|uniref:Phosphoethanolamine transferase n=1 Tax=Diaphorobacter ruginosibacter TaxID=1715720 RepID=A0A7G9RN30_9BURK|nr:phosphoethanolamine transferase [Diaphorobacter ruginosibacter]QNN57005.1 phosphoethanolamine transferase [Diaphorobacter ruginosibacter]